MQGPRSWERRARIMLKSGDAPAMYVPVQVVTSLFATRRTTGFGERASRILSKRFDVLARYRLWKSLETELGMNIELPGRCACIIEVTALVQVNQEHRRS